TVSGFATVNVSFSGLVSTDTNAHVNCCTASPGTTGAAFILTGFPVSVTAGTYSSIFDLNLSGTYTAGFVSGNGGTGAAAFSALPAGLAANEAYFKLDSTIFPGGEIRGFFAAEGTPLPAAFPLFATGLGAFGALGVRGWKRKRKAN